MSARTTDASRAPTTTAKAGSSWRRICRSRRSAPPSAGSPPLRPRRRPALCGGGPPRARGLRAVCVRVREPGRQLRPARRRAAAGMGERGSWSIRWARTSWWSAPRSAPSGRLIGAVPGCGWADSPMCRWTTSRSTRGNGTWCSEPTAAPSTSSTTARRSPGTIPPPPDPNSSSRARPTCSCRGNTRVTRGQARYAGENPPYGALLTVFLPDASGPAPVLEVRDAEGGVVARPAIEARGGLPADRLEPAVRRPGGG